MSEIQSISKRSSVVQNENELSIVISSAVDRAKAKNIGIILALWLIGGIVIGVNYFQIEDYNTKNWIAAFPSVGTYQDIIQGKVKFPEGINSSNKRFLLL